ncbi:MAG: hypothetical protein JWO72_508 [Caulobacteraceae bacterium]|jgi:hypothetical protein|nr:hypothetical protein [Caulobacteraceae bacterium]
MKLTEQPMNQMIQRLALVFVGIFAVSCVAVAVYQVVWVMPAKRCLEHNGWWDPFGRVCATPIFLPDLTHRPIGAPKLTPLSR